MHWQDLQVASVAADSYTLHALIYWKNIVWNWHRTSCVNKWEYLLSCNFDSLFSIIYNKDPFQYYVIQQYKVSASNP